MANANEKIGALIRAIYCSVDSDTQARADKGAALLAAHAALDKAGSAEIAAVDAAIAATRPAKNKDRRIEKAYKLGKRFTSCASFLVSHGMTFSAIGQTITDKKTVSINLVEAIRAALADSDNPYHGAAMAWSTSRDFSGYLLACAALDGKAGQAETAAFRQAVASQAEAMAAEKIAALVAQVNVLQAAAKKSAGKKSASK